MADRFGYFLKPGTADRPLIFQTLDLRHLPGKSILCPCWLRWLGWLATVVLPSAWSVGIKRWLRNPRFWWVKSPQYQLLHSIRFLDSDGTTWEVPEKFIFNGLSVPWIFWPICPADHPNALAASCVHDWMCSPPHPCNSETAARVFWEAMRANHMYKWGAWRNWFFVRWFGPRF